MSYEKVKEYIRSQNMLKEGDLVIAGVSGGADSMAMLDMLRRYRAVQPLALVVVHVNHGIRGEEALRDQRHVEAYCGQWGISFRCFHYDVPEYAGTHGLGIEEAGRLLRDQAFAQTEKEFSGEGKGVRIALAHNQNDLAETILHNLARGSGLRGIMGILPVSGKKIRPLLCLRRQEIEDYLFDQKLAYVTDSSNQESHYTRNRIRHHILPLIETEINEQAVPHLAETARQAAMAEEYLTRQGERLFRQYQTAENNVHFTGDFTGQEPVLKQYAVREALYHLGGFRKDLTSDHISRVLNLEKQSLNKRVCLPYGLTAVRTYDGILLSGSSDALTAKTAAGAGQKELTLPVPGTLNCGYGSFVTRIFFYHGEKIEEKLCTKWLDYDRIQKDLSVRTRKTGDYLVINEQGNHKKLSRCMIDDKIPVRQRDQIPLVVSGNEVLWIIGGRISERYKVSSGTVRVLEITALHTKTEL